MPTIDFLRGSSDALLGGIRARQEQDRLTLGQQEQQLRERQFDYLRTQSAPSPVFGALYGQFNPAQPEYSTMAGTEDAPVMADIYQRYARAEPPAAPAPAGQFRFGQQPQPQMPQANPIQVPQNTTTSQVPSPQAIAANQQRGSIMQMLSQLPADKADKALDDYINYRGHEIAVQKLIALYGPGGVQDQKINLDREKSKSRTNQNQQRIDQERERLDAQMAHWDAGDQAAADRLGINRDEFEALQAWRAQRLQGDRDRFDETKRSNMAHEDQSERRLNKIPQTRAYGSQGERTIQQMIQNGQWEPLLDLTEEYHKGEDATGQSVAAPTANALTAAAALEQLSPGLIAEHREAKHLQQVAAGAWLGKGAKQAAADAARQKLEARLAGLAPSGPAPGPVQPRPQPKSAGDEKMVPGKGAAAAGGVPAINTQAEFDALPPGTIYTDAKTGQREKKP